MPELPEVETILRGLAPYVLGAKIDKVISRCIKLRWPIPIDLHEIICGKTILDISRRGKYMLLHLENGTLIIHLGMSGRLCCLKGHHDAQKHDHVDIIISNNVVLRYTDPRRFGAVLWTTGNPETHPLLINLGVEPLSDDFNAEHLYKCTINRRMPVKPMIMSGKTVVGVGNIYAAEALFLSKIHPFLPVNKLTFKQCELLVVMIKQVLKFAITQGGTTLKDFVNSDGVPGYFSQKLNVYGRGGLPCVVCKQPLTACVLGQRATVFCEQCQR